MVLGYSMNKSNEYLTSLGRVKAIVFVDRYPEWMGRGRRLWEQDGFMQRKHEPVSWSLKTIQQEGLLYLVNFHAELLLPCRRPF